MPKSLAENNFLFGVRQLRRTAYGYPMSPESSMFLMLRCPDQTASLDRPQGGSRPVTQGSSKWAYLVSEPKVTPGPVQTAETPLLKGHLSTVNCSKIMSGQPEERSRSTPGHRTGGGGAEFIYSLNHSFQKCAFLACFQTALSWSV